MLYLPNSSHVIAIQLNHVSEPSSFLLRCTRSCAAPIIKQTNARNQIDADLHKRLFPSFLFARAFDRRRLDVVGVSLRESAAVHTRNGGYEIASS
jgi:hypothetical protein